MPRLVYESPETELQKKLGYSFKRTEYLREALTHSSYANERGLAQNNERLEFLGDAVLEVTISGALFKKFPDAREGDLTRMRAKLVSEGTLAALAKNLGIEKGLILGKGEESQGGRERPALLADALEAIFGALYMDAGYEEAKACLLRLYEGLWPESDKVQKGKDFKTHLQEVTQARYRSLPVYMPLTSYGPEHEKTFEVKLVLPDGQEFCASGPSMKRAEQTAASIALESLGVAKKAAPMPPEQNRVEIPQSAYADHKTQKKTGHMDAPGEKTPATQAENPTKDAEKTAKEREKTPLLPGEQTPKKRGQKIAPCAGSEKKDAKGSLKGEKSGTAPQKPQGKKPAIKGQKSKSQPNAQAGNKTKKTKA